VLFRNTSSAPVDLGPLGLGRVAPDDVIDVPEALWMPSRTSGGTRRPSPLERCAPQMVPADPSFAEEWRSGVPETASTRARARELEEQKRAMDAEARLVRRGLDRVVFGWVVRGNPPHDPRGPFPSRRWLAERGRAT
jgi:hypothetical protein